MTLGTMIAECDAMVAALNTYAECSNLDDDTKTDMRAWIKQTEADIAAGRKATIDQGAQGAIALACRRATASVQAATERCHAGRALPYEP